MKGEIYYPEKTEDGGYRITPCCSSGPAVRFSFILPGKQSSIVRIVKFPPVSRGKLKGMTELKIKTMYPGENGKTSFDFIPYKSADGWTVVIYILDSTVAYSAEAQGLKHPAILLPLQPLSRRLLKRFSAVLFIYPDMTEFFKLEGGIPSEYSRNQTGTAERRALPAADSVFTAGCPGALKGFPSDSAGSVTAFGTILSRSKTKPVYFPDLFKPYHGAVSLLSSAAALLLSTVLLISSISDFSISLKKLKESEEYLNSAAGRRAMVETRIERITELKELILKKKKEYFRSPYFVLHRLAGIPELSLTISTFVYSGKSGEYLITCTGKNPSEAMKRIKEEFPEAEFTRSVMPDAGTVQLEIRMEKGR